MFISVKYNMTNYYLTCVFCFHWKMPKFISVVYNDANSDIPKSGIIKLNAYYDQKLCKEKH